MMKKFEDFKITPEENIFYNELAEKYGLEQNYEYLIAEKDGKKIFIPKWRKIPVKEGKDSLDIEKYIEETLGIKPKEEAGAEDK